MSDASDTPTLRDVLVAERRRRNLDRVIAHYVEGTNIDVVAPAPSRDAVRLGRMRRLLLCLNEAVLFNVRDPRPGAISCAPAPICFSNEDCAVWGNACCDAIDCYSGTCMLDSHCICAVSSTATSSSGVCGG